MLFCRAMAPCAVVKAIKDNWLCMFYMTFGLSIKLVENLTNFVCCFLISSLDVSLCVRSNSSLDYSMHMLCHTLCDQLFQAVRHWIPKDFLGHLGTAFCSQCILKACGVWRVGFQHA